MTNIVQPVLASECGSCSWGICGFCDGPRDAATYLMQSDSHTTCLNTARRELMFNDTYKYFSPPAHTSQPSDIPNFTPTAVRGIVRLSSGFEGTVFGVSLGKIIGKRGNLAYETVDEVKKAFGLPYGCNLVLIGTSLDLRLERLWKIHKTHRIFERIASMGFLWATSLTYSVWRDEFPRPDQLKNQGRNYYTYDVMAGLGLPCIPFMFLIEDCDFVNAAHWLEDRPAIHTVAIYARYFGSEKGYQWLRQYMSRIDELVPRPLRFFVSGIANPRNIERLRSEFDARFENSHIFTELMRHQVATPNLSFESSSLHKDKILDISLKRHEEFCDPTKPLIYLADPKQVSSGVEIALVG